MSRLPIIFLFLTFLLPARGIFASAGVTISEISWMGSSPKPDETSSQAANNEWLELANSGASSVALDGWTLAAEDGAPNIILSGSISASGFFLLERTNDDTVPGIAADQIYTGALEDGGERLFLKDASGATIDEVNASSGWPAGDKATKYTMQRQGSSWITAEATPRAGLAGAAPAPQTSVPSSSTGGPSASRQVLPTMKVSAGEDKVAVAGGEIEFFGAAYDSHDEPFDKARFWWNFGDGETKEGRVVSHAFQIPGKYTVGLHVSSGSLASSDYLEVEVLPNKIYIAGVIDGEGGFIKLRNPVKAVLDIGGWVIKDASGNAFIIPAKTKIGAESEIAFSNRITGLIKYGSASRVAVFYPNLTEAFHWSVDTAGNTIAASGAKAVSTHATEISKEKQEIVEAREKSASLAQVSAGGTGGIGGKFMFFAAVLLSVVAAIGFLFFKKIVR